MTHIPPPTLDYARPMSRRRIGRPLRTRLVTHRHSGQLRIVEEPADETQVIIVTCFTAVVFAISIALCLPIVVRALPWRITWIELMPVIAWLAQGWVLGYIWWRMGKQTTVTVSEGGVEVEFRTLLGTSRMAWPQLAAVHVEPHPPQDPNDEPIASIILVPPDAPPVTVFGNYGVMELRQLGQLLLDTLQRPETPRI